MTIKNEQSAPLLTRWWQLDISQIKSLAIILFSYLVITWGQPVYSNFASQLAATAGYALFFSQILERTDKGRFFAGFAFFFAVQAVQLFWFTYHPIKLVIFAYLLLCTLMGLQFAILSLFANKQNLTSRFGFLLLPAIWTLLEWSRIYWCSGFYFDLTGLSLTTNLFTLQTGSLFGVLGMSFWVILTNASCLKAFLQPKRGNLILAVLCITLPYLYGVWHVEYHSRKQKAYDAQHLPLQALIVHSKKVPDEFKPRPIKPLNPQERAYSSWNDLISAISPYESRKLDLILMPEGVVPYGSTSLLFTKSGMQELFLDKLKVPFPVAYAQNQMLCSEDVAQAIATLFNCPLVIGLEGIEQKTYPERSRYYNSAFFFHPDLRLPPQRYDKQVLVPMGEYIPGNWAKQIAAKYGIFDSFTPGTRARLFHAGPMRIGASICYEETVGSIMRKYSAQGATLLVNLTDDYWFPYSLLGEQHFEHARPRTVENGVPLLRSCNFGISGAIDSLGRTIAAYQSSLEPSSFVVSVSSYHYRTLYGRVGDWPVLTLSLFIILAGVYGYRRKT